MSQKKIKQVRAAARRAQSPGVNAIDAMEAITVENTLMGGLRLGGRALKMVARRPFASLPMFGGLFGIWLPVAAVLANLVAMVIFRDGAGRERGLAFGFMLAMWLLAPIFAIVAVETAFMMAQRGRVRWRVALASFACEKGLIWLITGSLVIGLAIQAATVARYPVQSANVVIAGALVLLVMGMIARITIFLAATHLWAGEAGGRQAIAWAIRSIPRILCAWASAMMVMLMTLIILGGLILAMSWVVMLAASMGQGAQVVLALFVLWPMLILGIGALLVMEGRIMFELHALALAGPRKPATNPEESVAA